MKKFLLTFILFTSAQAEIVSPKELVANELIHLNQMIDATEWSFGQQQKLRKQIEEYQELQARYLKDQNDNDLLYQLIRSAYTILETIKALHLETAFEPDFLSELSVLARPAIKSGIPKP